MADGFYKSIDSINFQKDPANPAFFPGVDPDFGTGLLPGDPIYPTLLGPGGQYEVVFLEYLRSRSRGSPPLWLRDNIAAIPGGVDKFVDDWVDFLKHFIFELPNINEVHARTPFPVAPPATLPPLTAAVEAQIRADARAAFRTQFEAVLRIPTDWTDMDPSPERIDRLLDLSFKAYAGFSADDPVITPVSFFEGWKDFLTVTTTLYTASAELLDNPDVLVSFEEVFRGFQGSGLTPAQVTDRLRINLKNFIDRHLLTDSAHFLPSQLIDEFMREMRVTFGREQVLALTPNEHKRRSVMLIIFKILRVMLERLQETVSAQAQRLLFLGKVQEGYTELINRVPIYVEKPQELIGNINTGFQNLDSAGRPVLSYDLQRTFNTQTQEWEFVTDSAGNYVYAAVGDVIYATNTSGFNVRDPLALMRERLVGSQRINENDRNQFGLGEWWNSPVTGEQVASWPLYPDAQLSANRFEQAQTTLNKDTRREIIKGAKPTEGTQTNTSSAWMDAKGYAGISLREIFDYFANDPDYLKYITVNVPGDTNAEFQNSVTFGGTDKNAYGQPQHPFADMNGVVLPGVWWFVEQPLDGTPKWRQGNGLNDQNNAKTEGNEKRNSDINQQHNTWIENLRGMRGIAKDEAKDAQTSLTATREGINQQSNLMASIIQQLSGILGAIFK